MNAHFMRTAMLGLLAVVSGCTHPLTVKNLDSYRNTSVARLQQPLTLGIHSNTSDAEGRQLIKMISNELPKYNINATTSVINNEAHLDVVAEIALNSAYDGSGWNFLINWPGFLIFTPAWHGYNYEISHDFTINLSDPKTKSSIDSFTMPIELDIRHADFNRTWTEIGWLEWGIIPFVGGIVFINYDDNVTPLANAEAGPVIADYVAQAIANHLHGFSKAPPAQRSIDATAMNSP